MPIPIQITDGERIASLDHSTNSLQVMDYPHHEIHNGTNYRASWTQNVGSGNSISLSITTPASGPQCHILFSVASGKSCNIAIYEDTEITANTGNTVTPRNSNRNYPDNSQSSVVANATVNTTGRVQLVDAFVGQPGGGILDPAVGGEIEGRIEWVLGMNKSYTVIVTETAAEAQMMSISFDWYEHTPKTE